MSKLITLLCFSLLIIEQSGQRWQDFALAQPLPDRSLPNNSAVTKLLNKFEITGGTTAGRNLFHSFQEFTVPAATTVHFQNSTAIANIISRVTGTNISAINGTLSANGIANFFLINPNGIQVGKDAQLNLGGSLVLSTANSLIFGDRTEFSASDPRTPLLSINVPTGLQFNGSQVGQIEVQGGGRDTSNVDLRFSPFPTPPKTSSAPFLQVKPGQAIALIGGQVSVDGGGLYAPSGKIELAAVTAGRVSFDPNWQFGYKNIQGFGDVVLQNRAFADVSGGGIGNLHLQAANASVLTGASLINQNQGAIAGSSIQVDATGTVKVLGSDPQGGFNVSLILSEAIGTGKAGDILIAAQNLQLDNGGSVVARGFGLAPGGNLQADVSEAIAIKGYLPNNPIANSTLVALTVGSAKGGDVTINTKRIVITDGANINSSAFGTGNGGNLRLNASESIDVIGTNPVLPSGIVAIAFNRGNGGNLDITTAKLSVLGGARISASTGAIGNAGSLSIQASESVAVSGTVPNVSNPSLIDSSANILFNNNQPDPGFGLPAIPTGNAGSIEISTPKLVASDGGLISVKNDGTGNPGILSINTDSILLERKGGISAVSNNGSGSSKVEINTRVLKIDNGGIAASILEDGKGTDVSINATESIAIIGSGLQQLLDAIIPLVLGGGDSEQLKDFKFDVGIITSSFGAGQSGNIKLVTPNLTLRNGAFITTATTADGNAGDLMLRVSETIALFDSLISSNTVGSGRGGQIDVETGKLFGRGGGQFSSSTVSSGDAGDISVLVRDVADFSGALLNVPLPIRSPTLNIRSGLTATSSLSTGNTGNITLVAPQLRLNDLAAISTTSFLVAKAGNISIATERLQISDRAFIAGQSTLGSGGNLGIQASKLISLRQGGFISTTAGLEIFGGGDGGNLEINSPIISILDNSSISANAFKGEGGNIRIITQGLFQDASSKISASSRLGVDGVVKINSPDVTPTSGLLKLPLKVTDTSKLITLGCAVKPGSSFVVSGRGGLPPSPAEALRIPIAIADLPQPTQTQLPNVSEATNWRRTRDGKIQLTDQFENAGAKYADLRAVECDRK